jgi:hypothetical protein
VLYQVLGVDAYCPKLGKPDWPRVWIDGSADVAEKLEVNNTLDRATGTLCDW